MVYFILNLNERMSNMKNPISPKGGGFCELSSNVDGLILELHRLRSLNSYLSRELSRLQAENQRIYLESIY